MAKNKPDKPPNQCGKLSAWSETNLLSPSNANNTPPNKPPKLMKYSPKALSYGLSVLTAMAALIGAGAPLLAHDAKPNIVFILADNVGYGDLGPYGG